MQKRTLKRTKTNFGSDKSENEPLPKRTLANKEAKIGLYKNESWSEIKAKSARWKAKIGGGGTVYGHLKTFALFGKYINTSFYI